MPYDPPRQRQPKTQKDPLEIGLVFNVRPCGTCQFFWPDDPAQQPYGPYSSFDFNSNTPQENAPTGDKNSFAWINGTTRTPTFPDAEIMDGCRKAPIMTIGINPNLTAFAPGTTGASWCYPSFSSAQGTDSWEKYAYYYRYRSIFQEHFDIRFAERFLLPEGRVTASKAGVMVDFPRQSANAAFDMRVLYDGDKTPTAIHLPGQVGKAPYVVLVDANQRFAAGDLLAACIQVPGGQTASVFAQPISYYTQILPVLRMFEQHLAKKGHAGVKLRVGEDVGQLDMVACASPHWGPPWLGGSGQSENTIISNCVHKNAWAMKQIVQTRPAVLFLVGQASWNMFFKAFGRLVRAPEAIPTYPEDGPYTLLRLTTKQSWRFQFSTTIGRQAYSLSTRLVIAPHFSYAENFAPQYRLSPEAFAKFAQQYPAAAKFLKSDKRVTFQQPNQGFVAAGFLQDGVAVLAEFRKRYAPAAAAIKSDFYDSHQLMADALAQSFDAREMTFTPAANGRPGYLSRTDGPCTFCDNSHWRFPEGCPYGKPAEKQYSPGFLEKVVAAMVTHQTR
jgi:hypothetical protein